MVSAERAQSRDRILRQIDRMMGAAQAHTSAYGLTARTNRDIDTAFADIVEEVVGMLDHGGRGDDLAGCGVEDD